MRQPVKIELEGIEHQLLPTFDAYANIEGRCGALRSLYQRVMTGQVTLVEMGIIVAEGMKANGVKNVDEKAAQLRLFATGPFSDPVIEALGHFIAALGWTPEQKKKLDELIAAQEAATLT